MSIINRLTFVRRLQRAWIIYSDFGLFELLQRIGRRVGKRAGLVNPKLADWSRRKLERDQMFDSVFGTDTGGVQELFDYNIVGGNVAHGLSHIATDVSDFENLMKNLSLNLAQYTFVDLGCGKGRALILAARHPFAAVVGVDFVSAFVEAARKNVAAAGAMGLCSPVTLVLEDATKYEFPSGPVLLYMFNPFDSHIIAQVGKNARASLLRDPRPFNIAYMNPIHLDSLVESGWTVVRRGGGWVTLA